MIQVNQTLWQNISSKDLDMHQKWKEYRNTMVLDIIRDNMIKTNKKILDFILEIPFKIPPENRIGVGYCNWFVVAKKKNSDYYGCLLNKHNYLDFHDISGGGLSAYELIFETKPVYEDGEIKEMETTLCSFY